jgi:hypothetical protein
MSVLHNEAMPSRRLSAFFGSVGVLIVFPV